MRFVVWYFLVLLPLRLLGERGPSSVFFSAQIEKQEEGERGNSGAFPLPTHRVGIDLLMIRTRDGFRKTCERDVYCVQQS